MARPTKYTLLCNSGIVKLRVNNNYLIVLNVNSIGENMYLIQKTNKQNPQPNNNKNQQLDNYPELDRTDSRSQPTTSILKNKYNL